MKIYKLNYRTNKYKEVHKKWDTTLYDCCPYEEINCVNCGRRVIYDLTKPSMIYKPEYKSGHGFAVCNKCYNREIKKLQGHNVNILFLFIVTYIIIYTVLSILFILVMNLLG